MQKKKLVRELIRRRSTARKSIESAKYMHIRERAKGRLSEIENTLAMIGHVSCK